MMLKSPIFKRANTIDADASKLLPETSVNEVGFILRQTYTLYYKAYEKVLSKFQLTDSQWVTLYILWFEGSPLSPSDLSKFLPIENTSISPVLDKLEEFGFIRRQRSKIDKRTVKVFLTDSGYQLLKEVNPSAIELANFVYGSLTALERKTLINISRKIRDRVMNWNAHDPKMAESIFRRLTKPNFM
jgi:DNA-binding MarR family transcriptional regulator